MGITIQNILLFLLLFAVGAGLDGIGKILKGILDIMKEQNEQRKADRAETGPAHNQTRW